MEDLKQIKKCLVAQVMGQMGNLQECDAKELGEVIDMIKDMEEAMYYCTIVKAMEEEKEPKRYSEPMMYSEPMRMYTDRPMSSDTAWGNAGRVSNQRRMYMEAATQPEKMKELEKYIKELTDDIMEMVKDATPEERTLLQRKITMLANKLDV